MELSSNFTLVFFKGNGFVLVSAFYIYSAVGGEWGGGGGERSEISTFENF